MRGWVDVAVVMTLGVDLRFGEVVKRVVFIVRVPVEQMTAF
jgi:hypothetical protein